LLARSTDSLYRTRRWIRHLFTQAVSFLRLSWLVAATARWWLFTLFIDLALD
jgi:hypothetical protein